MPHERAEVVNKTRRGGHCSFVGLLVELRSKDYQVFRRSGFLPRPPLQPVFKES